MPERAPFVALLVNFTAELRAAGLPVGSGDVLAYCAAMSVLDPTDLLDLYWAGRTTLVTRRENIPVYDRVFRRFFLGSSDPVRGAAHAQAARAHAGPRGCSRSRPPIPGRTARSRRAWA